MKNVTQVLAQMGESANLQLPEAAAEFVNQSELSAELQTALLEQDVTTLERNLDVCPDIVCFIMSPEDDEPSEDDSEKEDKSEENSLTSTVVNY